MVAQALKILSSEEISKHKSRNDLWITIHGKVYDISAFVEEHPGGPEVLQEHAGVDGTTAFEDVGHSDHARELMSNFLIGYVAGAKTDEITDNATVPPPAESPARVASPISTIFNSKWLLLTIGGAIIAGLLAYHYTSRDA